MSLAAFAQAGYSPIPLRGGRPAVGGVFSNNPTWRYTHGDEARFADCGVGLLCSARPLSGASGPATYLACASTWVCGVRWETTDRKLSAEVAAIVERIAGPGPLRLDGPESLRIFKLEWPQQPFMPRRLSPWYFPKEHHTDLSYWPHRLDILSMASWLNMSGGTWTGGMLPEVKRDELPTLTAEQAHTITSEVETLFTAKGALPWL
jgi:hypothetical protein